MTGVPSMGGIFFSIVNMKAAVNYTQFSIRINLPLFSTVVPSHICIFQSCRSFVDITTLSTGLVGVEECIRWDDGGK